MLLAEAVAALSVAASHPTLVGLSARPFALRAGVLRYRKGSMRSCSAKSLVVSTPWRSGRRWPKICAARIRSPRVAGEKARSLSKVPTTPGASSLIADVDAAPPGAIVGIAAQAIGLVNVVRVAIGIGRVSEYPRQLARGELACGLRRQRGNASATLSLTSRNATRQRDCEREP